MTTEQALASPQALQNYYAQLYGLTTSPSAAAPPYHQYLGYMAPPPPTPRVILPPLPPPAAQQVTAVQPLDVGASSAAAGAAGHGAAFAPASPATDSCPFLPGSLASPTQLQAPSAAAASYGSIASQHNRCVCCLSSRQFVYFWNEGSTRVTDACICY